MKADVTLSGPGEIGRRPAFAEQLFLECLWQLLQLVEGPKLPARAKFVEVEAIVRQQVSQQLVQPSKLIRPQVFPGQGLDTAAFFITGMDHFLHLKNPQALWPAVMQPLPVQLTCALCVARLLAPIWLQAHTGVMNRSSLAAGLLATMLLHATYVAAAEYYTAYKPYSQGYDAAQFFYLIPGAATWKYDYCIHFTGDRFVYYYNPSTRLYWAAYDLEARGFSLIARKDQKGNLRDIPEAAFPAPAPNAIHPVTGNPIPVPHYPPTRPPLAK